MTAAASGPPVGNPGTPDFEKFIKDRSYVENGADFSPADLDCLAKLNGKIPDMQKLPSTYRWALHIHALQRQRPFAFSTSTTSSGNSKPQGGNKPGAAAQMNNKNNASSSTGGGAKGKDEANIEGKLPNAVMGKVCTRFPPEPSGYMHIGHAKAALLNNAYARMYEGKLIIRFDDTNPSKEKQEFEDTILEDSKSLGIVPDFVSHTSDYFPKLQELMEKLLKNGDAYVDDTPVEKMRDERDNGVESACRKFSVEKNLELWKEMLAGTKTGLTCCVRGKMNMKDPVKCLRDPVFYRCKTDVPHHRHGTKYKAYPTYDFACPIVDAIEGVSHSLRTIEYKDRDQMYYWVQQKANVGKTILYEFSKTQFTHTVLSKRKLTWFVDNKVVSGWDDPRFPTVKGILRRGMTVQALQEFMKTQGASKRDVLMEWDKIWVLNRQIIDPQAARYAAITAPVTLKISGVPAESYVGMTNLHPKCGQEGVLSGQKPLWYGASVFLEAADAAEIAEQEQITLLHWGNVLVEKVTKDAAGKVTLLEAKLHLEGSVKDTKKKLHWVAATGRETEVVLREYDHLISKAKLDEDDKFEDFINPQTIFDTVAVGEAPLKNVSKGDIVQLERIGFFICDSPAFPEGQPMVLIKIPDGKSKAMSNIAGKVDPSKLQGAKGKEAAAAAAPAADPAAAQPQASPEDLAKLQAAKDLVAKLKADKASDEEIQAAVAEMKRLKEVCGEKELSKAERKKLEKAAKAKAKA
ncbi:unnamed protein product [Amoebophrya sp. A120]|nr:unnamed protein product [Amoebophrya sp. A120]|eukprot:GSA120T00001932001.1